MNEITRLSRPKQSQVRIDPTPKDCPSDGFNYPSFRLINKQGRVNLSSKPLDPQPSNAYRLFAVANSSGWFVAVQSAASYSLILSPLDQLRSAFKTAKEDKEVFTPQRTLSIASGKPNILVFAYNDTRLFVGFEQGHIHVYDTTVLFRAGSDDVVPLHVLDTKTGPSRQILPNPGTESNLVELVAVVCGDGTVQLLNMQLESQGGWTSGDLDSTPVAVAWSPKGKHLAIGMHCGDILTFSLTNKSSPHKHIPATAAASLVSLNWVGPGHTFRTSYAPTAPNGSDSAHHIISLDVKTSTATYLALIHPYTISDRSYQYAYTITLPKWDEGGSSTEESKSLFVVGDKSSVDLEVLGNTGSQWYQQSQDNPLTLPLDKNMEDTILLALDLDLTDSNTGAPIMYAFLNDGTLQGWYIEHPEPYLGMVTPRPADLAASSAATPTAGQSSTPSTFGQSPPSAFGVQSAAPAFGQTTFGQPSAPVFGQSSVFGQQQHSSAFGSGFGQQSTSAFGQSSQSSTASAFGQVSSSFGQTTTLSSSSNSPSPFGRMTQQQQPSSGSVFGQSSQPSGFGSPQSAASAFGGGSTGAFGGGSSSAFGSGSKSAFGGGSSSGLGGGSSSGFGGGSSSGFGGGSSNVFGGGSSSGFGGGSSSGFGVGSSSGFGGGSSSPSAFGNSATSAFGAPKTGAFGSFGHSSGTANVFGQAGFGFSTPSSAVSPPPSTAVPAVAPAGMTREASMSESTPSFSGFSLGPGGSSSDSKTPQSGGGAFGSLPSPPAAPSSTTSFGGMIKPATGFGAFGNFSTTQSNSAGGDEQSKLSANPSSTFVGGGAKPPVPSSAFGQSSFGQSSFGKSAFGQSAFGQPSLGKPIVPVATPSSGGGFAAFASSTPTTFGGSAPQQRSESAGGASAAFGSGGSLAATSSSSGFGAFASTAPASFGGASQQSGSSKATVSSSSATQFKSPFAPGSSEGSPFGGGSASGAGSVSNTSSALQSQSSYRGGSPLGGGDTPKARTKPIVPLGSPPSSPSPPPSPPRAKILSPLENDNPSTPPLKSSAIASGSGAFGNLKTSPSIFKPASGFGAFGSDSTPTSSPFFKAAEAKNPPVLAFSPNPTPPGPAVAASAPTFGAPSMMGGAKSAFAPTTPSSPTPIKTPQTGGFGAFSGSSSGFGAFSGPTTSFGELLKMGDTDVADPVKPSVSGASAIEEHKPTDNSGTKDKSSVSTSKPTAPEAVPDPVFSSRGSATSASKPKEDIPTPDSKPQASPPKDRGPSPERSNAPPVKQGPSTTVSDEPSFGSLSLSESGSFVEISEDNDDEGSEGSLDSGDTDSDGQPGDEGEDGQTSLSESYSSDAEELSDHSESDAEDRSRSSSPEPTTIPLPASRSPSATPQPETLPSIQVTPSPPAADTVSESPGLSTITEESITPPGTPVRGSSQPSKNSSSVLTPVSSSTTTSPFGLGLGRPSTRPARSSPLASAPVSLEDDDERHDAKPSKEVSPKIPVSPQPRLGALPIPLEVPLKTESDDETKLSGSKPARPKTPPLLSAFGNTKTFVPPPAQLPLADSSQGKTASTDSSSPSSRSRTSPLSASSSAVGSQGPPTDILTPPLRSSAPSPSPRLFGNAPAKPFTNATLTAAPVAPSVGSLLGGPPTTPATPNTYTPASTPPGGSFNLKGTAAAPQSSLFGRAIPPSASPSTFKPNISGFPARSPPPEASMEEGMQKECAALFSGLNRELEDLRSLAQAANKKRVELETLAGGSRRKADLGDTAKWGFGDLVKFGQVLHQYEQDLAVLKEQRDAQSQSLRELQSNMLKAGTRREEIIRFNKAKNDNEFAKMLKSRTLGPEHLETQTQLRRNIRTMRDRVQKLEDHLKNSKKRLVQMTTGKPGLRAPSLDTINRTYRNIDIAIQQQADDVSQLASRISKLDVATQLHALDARDPRLPDMVSKRPYNVTPHVAITTAAALNAERSAQKLKRALLTVRKEPLLNTTAVVAPPAPVAFSTPQKPSSFATGFSFQTPVPGPFFGTTPDSTPQAQLPDWTLPEDNFNPSTPPSGRRGAGVGFKKLHNSVPLKRSAGASSSPPAATFNWGPLPTFNQIPAATLVEGVKFAPPSLGTKPMSSGDPSSGSWIAGIGKKG